MHGRLCHVLASWELVLVSLVTQIIKNLPPMRETGLDPWVRKIPWRRKWQPTPVFLPGDSHGGRSLAGHSPRGREEWDTTGRLTLTHSLPAVPGLLEEGLLAE